MGFITAILVGNRFLCLKLGFLERLTVQSLGRCVSVDLSFQQLGWNLGFILSFQSLSWRLGVDLRFLQSLSRSVHVNLTITILRGNGFFSRLFDSLFTGDFLSWSFCINLGFHGKVLRFNERLIYIIFSVAAAIFGYDFWLFFNLRWWSLWIDLGFHLDLVAFSDFLLKGLSRSVNVNLCFLHWRVLLVGHLGFQRESDNWKLQNLVKRALVLGFSSLEYLREILGDF